MKKAQRFNLQWLTLYENVTKEITKGHFTKLPGFQVAFLRNFIYAQLPLCGQSINSMFFDNFTLVDELGETVPMTIDGINHDIDREVIRNVWIKVRLIF